MTQFPEIIFFIIVLLAMLVAAGLWAYNSYHTAQWAFRAREDNVCRCRNRDCKHIFIASRHEDSVRCPKCGEINMRGRNGSF